MMLSVETLIVRGHDHRALCCSAAPIIAQYYQVTLSTLS